MITDTGIRMSKGFIPHLFNEFARETKYRKSLIIIMTIDSVCGMHCLFFA